MDATLLRDDKTFDKAYFLELVDALKTRGDRVCIASGNTVAKLKRYFDEQERRHLIFAGSNGNDVQEGETVLRQTPLSSTTTQAIMDYLATLNGYYGLIGTPKGGYTVTQDSEALAYFRKYNPSVKVIASVNEIPEDEVVLQIAIMSKQSLAENKQVVAELNERFSEARAVTSGDKWLDIFSIYGGKGAAVDYLLKHYGYDSMDSLAFGDSLNDQTMMEVVEYSIAMGNADPDLVKVCHYQIGTNEQQAVIHVLAEIVEDASLSFMKKYKR